LRTLRLWREKEKRKNRKARQAAKSMHVLGKLLFFYVLWSWRLCENLLTWIIHDLRNYVI
jgi:hypothetical protein